MNTKRLMTNSLLASPHGDKVARIMVAAINAVDPFKAVQKNMHLSGNKLKIGEQDYNLDELDRVILIGFGKASLKMGQAVANLIGDILCCGILVTKGFTSQEVPKTAIIQGSHPIPDQRSILASEQVVELLKNTTEKDLVICLISGGGSALLTLPVKGVPLEDIQKLTELLLGCGATINEINCLRKHLSQVKGGQLARYAAPSEIATLILSDVVGDPLDVIASGPTVPDPTTYFDAMSILEKYNILIDTPSSIRTHLKQGVDKLVSETPKTDDFIFNRVQNLVVGNNYLASKAAINQANLEGFNTLLLTTSLQGEASIAGKIFATITKQVVKTGEPISRPACIVAGGETTVTIQGDGLGGRNQELALGAVEGLSGLDNVMLIALATDGDDGPTDAAGAVVTGETLFRAIHCDLDPSHHLSRNASYEFFQELNDLLKPGMTGTNVNDITLLIIF